MDISIKKQIIINTVFISWCAIIIVVGLILWRTDKLGTLFLSNIEEQRLTSIRYFKSQQIIDYFKTLNDNIANFAINTVTVEALQNFSNTFPKYLSEAKSLATGYKSQVIDKYLNDFVDKYKYYNVGKTVDAQNILNLISEQAFALQYVYIFDNPYQLSEKYKLNIVADGSQYSMMHAQYHQTMVSFKKQFGFYDIFLIDKNGNIVYTVNKEIDFTTSLVTGPYAKSNLAELFNKVIASDKKNFIVIADFAPYLASYDNQAAFMGTAVFDKNGNKLGVVVAQLSVDILNNIMTNQGQQWEKIGLGKSINAVIVGQDLKLRNDNRFFFENKIDFLAGLKKSKFSQQLIDLIKVKNSCIGLLTTDTLAVRESLAGKEATIKYVDYRNIPVIGSFAPLAIPGLNWVIIVKINQEEAFQGIKILKQKIMHDGIWFASVIAIIAVLLGIIIASSIVKSIYSITRELNDIAQSKDLTKRLTIQKNSEFTIMINVFNNFLDSIHHAFKNIQNSIINKLQPATQDPNSQDQPKDLYDLVDEVQDLYKEFRIIEDQNDRIKYW